MKKKRLVAAIVCLVMLLALIPIQGSIVSAAPPLPGAIFTTTVDGSIVNENVHYEAKEDVYLDGGPGPECRNRPFSERSEPIRHESSQANPFDNKNR